MLYQNIQNEIKKAMKQKNKTKKDTLRNVISKAQTIEKEKNPHSTYEDISDEVVIAAIQKEIKQLKQTLDSIPETMVDMKNDTLNKTSIIEIYLPKQLSAQEIENVILSIVNDITEENKGSIMKKIIPILKGKADGKLINKVVDKLLSN